MTAPYGLPTQELLRGLLSGPHRVQVTGSPGTGLELFLNTPAQKVLAQSAGLPLSRLTALLPALTDIPERLADPSIVRAAWYVPRKPWVGTCPECSGRLWLTRRPVLAYPGVAGHVCRRHRRWLLADADKPASIALQTLPEVLAAHRQHRLLTRSHPYAQQVVAFAAAVVWSWQVQGWKAEAIWKDRARRVAGLLGCTPAAVEPHALLTYPETISVARLLSAPHWQQRLRSSTSEKEAAAAALVQEIGRRAGRPWLADWLNARARVRPRSAAHTDPLQQWCDAAAAGADAGGLWAVHQDAARPADYSDRAGLLSSSRARSVLDEARAVFLTGGWEPVSAPSNGARRSCVHESPERSALLPVPARRCRRAAVERGPP
ncbi:TniQ family protein [Streptomyces sp. NPDC054844]